MSSRSDEFDSKKSEKSRKVKVYCRIRPPDQAPNIDYLESRFNNISFIEYVDGHTIHIKSQRNGKIDNTIQECKFSYVFPITSIQSDIFKTIAYPMVVDLFKFKDNLLFTYGVTASGKTYTLTGTPAAPGIIPRTLSAIFQSVQNKLLPYNRTYLFGDTFEYYTNDQIYNGPFNKSIKGPALEQSYKTMQDNSYLSVNLLDFADSKNEYAVYISFVEIYNNKIYDLLSKIESHHKIIKTVADTYLNSNLFNECQYYCSDINQAFSAYLYGRRNRHISKTELNERSSRGHCIFTIKLITLKFKNDLEFSVYKSHLTICDLAGSERTKRTKNEGERLKETSFINTSLSALQNCILALRSKQSGNIQGASVSRIIPYRDNNLTHFFKQFFEGIGRMHMFVCVSPDTDDVDENLQITRFANAVKDVEIPYNNEPAEPMFINLLKSPCIKRNSIPSVFKKLKFDDQVVDNEGKTKRLSSGFDKHHNVLSNLSFSGIDSSITEFEKLNRPGFVLLLNHFNNLSSELFQKNIDILINHMPLIQSHEEDEKYLDSKLIDIFKISNYFERVKMVISSFDLQNLMRKCENKSYKYSYVLKKLISNVYNQDLAKTIEIINNRQKTDLIEPKDYSRIFTDDWKRKLKIIQNSIPYENKVQAIASGLSYPSCPPHILKSPADQDLLKNLRNYVIDNIYFFEELYINSKKNLEDLQYYIRQGDLNYRDYSSYKSATDEKLALLSSELNSYKIKLKDSNERLHLVESENNKNLNSLNTLRNEYRNVVESNRTLTQAFNNAEATFKERFEEKYKNEYKAMSDNMVKSLNKIQQIKDIANNDAYRKPYAK